MPTNTIVMKLDNLKLMLDHDKTLADMSTDEILSAFKLTSEFTVEIVKVQAQLILVLVQRKCDLSDLNLGIRRHQLLRIAHGQMLPEAYVKFIGSLRAAQCIGNIPLSDQQRLVESGRVEIVVPETPNGGYTTRMMNPEYMSGSQLRQVFTGTGIRDREAQIAFLESIRTNCVVALAKTKNDIRIIGNLHCDRSIKIVKVIKGKTATASDIIAAAKFMESR